MRTNLLPNVGPMNRYYRVTRKFEALELLGHRPSNAYYGSSLIYGAVYRRITVKRGDEVHALCGGTFVVRANGDTFPARMRVSEKSAFERGESTDLWPLACLREGPRQRTVGRYPHPDRLFSQHAGFLCPNGMDTILSEADLRHATVSA